MGDTEYYGTLKKSQHFKPFLQAFIKKQIQSMLDELAYETGTESLVVLANIETGTAFSLGSTYSPGFVETTNVKNEFLAYCMSRYHAGDVPVHPALLANSGKKRKGSPWGPKCKRQAKGSKTPTGNMNNTKLSTATVSGDITSTENHMSATYNAESGVDNNTANENNVLNMGTNEVNTSGADSQSMFDSSVTVKMEPLSDSDVSINQGSDTSFNSSLDFSSQGLINSGLATPPTFGPIRFVRKYPPKERTTLTLPEKILIIEDYESGATMSQRRLADKYNISKSAVADMLKNRQLLKDHYEFNANTKRKRFNTTSRFAEINEIVWQWFKTARENGIQMSGPMIQEKALQVAQLLQVTDFKGSNGWLHSWRSRYNVTSYRDENAPPQKQTYINDYSKIEGFNPMTREKERSNAIMNYGSLLPNMGGMNDTGASNSIATNEQIQDMSTQSATVTENPGTSPSEKEVQRNNIILNYFNMTGAQNSVQEAGAESESKPVDHPGNEQIEEPSKSEVNDNIDRLSNAWNASSTGESAEVKTYVQSSELRTGNNGTSTSSKASDENCQSTAYESIVQNALSDFEENKFAC